MAGLWHAMNYETVVCELRTDEQDGISPNEARRRLGQYGPNELSGKRKKSSLAMFFGQFEDFMVLVLLGATAVSALMGEIADAVAIVLIVVLNACLGYVQESRAERSLEALKEMAAPAARVMRAGILMTVPARDIVPGDILVLSQGDKIAADARLISSSNLEVNESTLTGESFPARKRYRATCHASASLGDRSNMVYSSTMVTKGLGHAAVVATGMETEVGAIASSISEVETGDTPLQQRLDALGKVLVAGCLTICAVVGVTGVIRGEPPYQMILVGVSLAVAAIPEGLPAVVTISLALGVQRMIAKKAIVRRLPAVETLGCATVICSDKTGTITRNEMTVRAVVTPAGAYNVTGSGYDTYGRFEQDSRPVQVTGDLRAALLGAVMCNNAWVEIERHNGLKVYAQGDPTEVALLVAGLKAGLSRAALEEVEPRVAEVPFESERKCMSVVNLIGGQYVAYVKGAPDVVLSKCTRVLSGGREVPFDETSRQRFGQANETMTRSALRVLAVARRTVGKPSDDPAPEEIEADLTFLGLLGMIDPPRPEVAPAVAKCHRAGLRVMVITGDHRNTAEAVAREAGIPGGRPPSLSGLEIDSMEDRELAASLQSVSVFARTSPKHKIRIVRALQQKGHIVAMTGDGVNDAPAIKEADIGVAMGLSGTDVSREAADMVLSDDNFATIVAAIEEGRGIYDNIRKFIRYLLSCNVGEVLVMFLASVLGLPVPLLPIQMLWVNLVTDGLPAMALGVDPQSRDLMSDRPRAPRESVFSRGLGLRIVERGALIGLGSLFVFIAALGREGDLVRARTMAFATLVMFQLFHVFDCRTERGSVFDAGFFGNRVLVLAVLCSVVMMLLVLYVPALSRYFHTAALDAPEWLVVLATSGVTTAVQGVLYLFRRKWSA
ncbi:MAG: calcium-translocating P-type ATPase, SERCA-type [Bacillota bacterium]|nr:calcium-translocating P-type ATPase, SERCA-type [Bacillota bacterium]